MSRRRGEFEHRTSIFEGAFRAWSHLGGLEPEDLEVKPAAELDPLTNPIDYDTRISEKHRSRNADGSLRREYPYEPLPRAGLAHPYVQAILSPWLGPDADNEAIQLGLTTLRTWWQHRRKGESGSAIAALGTEKMKGVVEGYTRHFFTLAHCLIVNDKEQPPRTLHGKMKELEKMRSKRTKKRTREGDSSSPTGDPISAGLNADLMDQNLSPLERLHAAQRRQMENSSIGSDLDAPNGMGTVPMLNLTGKCIPGKIDLAEVVETTKRSATHLAHRGFAGNSTSVISTSSSSYPLGEPGEQYGDPNTTPVVLVSVNGDIQIAMTIEGITCAHCVKIVETVLKGCNGTKSPIEGLLDAAADRVLNSVLIKIDKASNAKRIASEAARNLAMVGYTAKAKEMSIVGHGADRKATMDLGALSTAFEVVDTTDTKDIFDWSTPCTCPDNGVLREDCARHSQMNTRIFEAFEAREEQVKDFVAGCGMKYGMDCTCGPNCRCLNCPMHSNGNTKAAVTINPQCMPPPAQQRTSNNQNSINIDDENLTDVFEPPLQVEHQMEFFGLEPPSAPAVAAAPTLPRARASILPSHSLNQNNHSFEGYRAQRNASIISFGNSGLRNMSMTSETTFGRAMSGLSALSIDWENLDDFDVDVDHSAHINNNNLPKDVLRRTSLRRSFMAPVADDGSTETTHVSFKS